jgi:hypothetical protein
LLLAQALKQWRAWTAGLADLIRRTLPALSHVVLGAESLRDRLCVASFDPAHWARPSLRPQGHDVRFAILNDLAETVGPQDERGAHRL